MADLRRLQVFHAVVEQRSVTAAASTLGFTPSAVSQQLAALERETGTALFERLGRRMVPTRAGLLLDEAAQPLLRAGRRVDAVAAAVRRSTERVFRLGAVPDAAAAIVPAALMSLTRDQPGLSFDIHESTTKELGQLLDQGALDAAVVDDYVDRAAQPAGPAGATVLADLPLAIVTQQRPGHRREGVPTWWLSSTQPNTAALVHWVARTDPTARVRFGTSTRAVLRMVEAGLGSAFASTLHVAAARADVRLTEPQGLPLRHQLRLVAPNGHDAAAMSAVASALLQAAAAVLPTAAAPSQDAS